MARRPQVGRLERLVGSRPDQNFKGIESERSQFRNRAYLRVRIKERGIKIVTVNWKLVGELSGGLVRIYKNVFIVADQAGPVICRIRLTTKLADHLRPQDFVMIPLEFDAPEKKVTVKPLQLIRKCSGAWTYRRHEALPPVLRTSLAPLRDHGEWDFDRDMRTDGKAIAVLRAVSTLAAARHRRSR